MQFYPDSLNNSFINNYSGEISFIGTLATLIGLCLSIYIFIAAKRINRFLFYTRRLPKLFKKIEAHTSAISSLLNNFDDSKDSIRLELTKCSANLKSLQKKVPRNSSKSIKLLIKDINKKTSNDKFAKDAIRKIYLDLQYINEEIQNIKTEYEMEKKYGN